MFAPLGAKPKLDGPSHEPLQRKLRLGSANDSLEQEADRVAGQVTGLPGSSLSLTSAPLQISRKCAACEEETVKRKESGPHAVTAEVPDSVHKTLQRSGQPLDPAARAFFDPRFGFDFSRVRIHADAAAAESAAAIRAR